jgi:GPH family glycoside/pentoside/hexuronide:cation symporter
MLGAQVQMLAWVLGLLQLPLINWACRRFQKHRVLQFAIVWMSIGTALNWWLMNPDHPEYQFILPFFFSVGIGSVYTVLPTLMADVTDWDELKYGLRREGMFGAVMGFLMKLIGTMTPIAAGVVLVLSGFDATLEYRQEPETILNMRIMFSFVPATMLLFALAALWKYPLTRERVAEIKSVLDARHEAEDSI